MAQSINNLAIGDKIKFGRYNVEADAKQDIIWQIAAKNHQGYPAGSTTLLTEKIIDLRGFDAKEPSNSNADRKSSGNNRYRDSNVRQWLNKGGSPWFQKTHTADEAPTDGGMNQPTGYDTKEGFLSSFTDEELAVILDTDLTVALNTVTDGGGSETVTDKVFLLSNTEVGLANENNIVEGGLLPLFTNDASRISYLTQQAFDNTNSTSKPANASAAWYWWLRTPNASNSRGARCVSPAGSRDYNFAYVGNYGVRPALNLKSDLLVSDTADSSGAYTIIYTYVLTLDKAINIQAGEKLEKLKFDAKVNTKKLNFKEIDNEKITYTGEMLNTDTVKLEIEGKDGKIDNIAYTII